MTLQVMLVTTVILAGGLGKRIGGNKAQKLLQGKPLIAWVLDSVGQHSAEILINANFSAEGFSQYGYRVVADQYTGNQGPLAGLHAAMACAKYRLVVTVPCDTPFLPHDLILRLLPAVAEGNAEAAVVVVEGCRQPTLAIYNRAVLPKLSKFLESGGRKVGDWLDTLIVNEVMFDNEIGFGNINSMADLESAEILLEKMQGGV